MSVAFPSWFIENILARRGRQHVFDALEPRRTALLVVDMQNAWLQPGAPWEVQTARAIVPNVNRLARALREHGGVVAWLQATNTSAGPDAWPMFFDHFTSAANREAGENALAPGSPFHALYAELEVLPQDPCVRKRRFSPFIAGSSNLEALLRDRAIDTVIITGTRTNVCCETTARDAMMLDFKAVMVSDATAAASELEQMAGLMTVFQVFGDVRTTDEVVALIEQGAAVR
jgi:ureidoacrylate peracid hydrolase